MARQERGGQALAGNDGEAAYRERFAGRVGPRWRRMASGGGELAVGATGLRLSLFDATAGALSLAQLDEGSAAAAWRWRPPLRLTIRARWSASASALVGTSGFGFWNDPWTAAGFGRAPAWLWFAHYSAPSHVALAPTGYGHGPRAAVLAAPNVGRFGLWLGNLALRLPGIGRLAVGAAARVVSADDLALDHDLSDWHRYQLDWRPSSVAFSVDGRWLGRVATAPSGPLGFVAWIDNQWAALGGDGRSEGGYLAVDQPQWLELSELSLEPLPAGDS